MKDTCVLNSKEKVLRMYEQGFSCKDICSICNIPMLTVRGYLLEAGFNPRNYRKVSDINKNNVIILIAAGYPYGQIQRLLHISTHLIREIVLNNGLIGFAPHNPRPVELNVKESDISHDCQADLMKLYLSGSYGLSKCASIAAASSNDLLWFIFHLTEAEKQSHEKQIRKFVQQLYNDGVPATAIAKRMDISTSIVKKMIKGFTDSSAKVNN